MIYQIGGIEVYIPLGIEGIYVNLARSWTVFYVCCWYTYQKVQISLAS